MPCLLIMLVDLAISQTRYLMWLSLHFVVKPPLSCKTSMVSAAYSLTPTPAFLALTWTWTVGIGTVLASAMTYYGKQKASHSTLGSQWWSIIGWWISYTCCSIHASGVLNISSRVTGSGSKSEECESKVLGIVSKVGRQSEYIYGLRGISLSREVMLAAIQLGRNLLEVI